MNFGLIVLNFSQNNIFFALSCTKTKKTVFNNSSRQLGFKNYKKDSIQIIYEICSMIKQSDFKFFILKITGLNKLRNTFIKQMIRFNLNIIKTLDLNTKPFNGCRLRKKRRI